MTKNNLKTGMIVESKGGWFGIVHRGTESRDFIHWIRDESGVPISKYRTFDYIYDDLTYTTCSGSSKIIRVYSVCDLYRNIDSPEKMLRDKALLWTSPDLEESKEVTMAEVEEKFGCKVKIIAEE